MNDKDSQHLVLHCKLIQTFLTNLHTNNKNVPFDEIDCKDNSYLSFNNLTTVIQRPPHLSSYCSHQENPQ